MVGIELVKDRATKAPFPLEEKVGIRVIQEARKRGIVIRPLGDIIVIMPPLSISLDHLAELMDGVFHSIEQVTASCGG